MIIFLLLSIVLIVLLVIQKKKLNKILNYKYLTDNTFIVNAVSYFDRFKNDVLSCIDSQIQLKSVIYKYFNEIDDLKNGYFYPKVKGEIESEVNKE